MAYTEKGKAAVANPNDQSLDSSIQLFLDLDQNGNCCSGMPFSSIMLMRDAFSVQMTGKLLMNLAVVVRHAPRQPLYFA